MVSKEPDLSFRRAVARDESFLRQMLWLAVHWRDSEPPPPDAVVAPELTRYTDAFGRRGDRGLIATCHDSPIGAAWCRLLTAPNAGYGYVTDDVPELSIAVLPEYRSEGVGSQLIQRFLSDLAGDVEAISLSVEPTNPARVLYERYGFATVREDVGALTMLKSMAATHDPR